MKHTPPLSSRIVWAIASGHIPPDIAGPIQRALDSFRIHPDLFDSGKLSGHAKQAELLVKLGYWLAVGQLSAPEFRLWAASIPLENNSDWDVDLLPAGSASLFRRRLRMGPLTTLPAACAALHPASLSSAS